MRGKTKEELAGYSFVIFNEPDGIWYQNNVSQMCTDWLKIYTTIKGIDPDIQVAGPNSSVYNSSAYQTFFKFCEQNDCLPEYVTWHELQKDKLTSFQSHCDEVKGYIETYYKGSGINPVIFVNETVNFDDVGNPGALVNWLAVFDEEDVYASLPYWGLANSMNELAADTNKPNGAWWVYKWYAQMTGNKAPLTLENIEAPSAYGRLYGLTGVDEDAGMICSLFGGQAGKQTIKSLKFSAAGTLTVKWTKDKKASGYQIQYSLNKKFKKAKTVTIKKSGTASGKIKKLKAGPKYYVRVRAYKICGKTKLYGNYSKAKSVKVKKYLQ